MEIGWQFGAQKTTCLLLVLYYYTQKKYNCIYNGIDNGIDTYYN